MADRADSDQHLRRKTILGSVDFLVVWLLAQSAGASTPAARLQLAEQLTTGPTCCTGCSCRKGDDHPTASNHQRARIQRAGGPAACDTRARFELPAVGMLEPLTVLLSRPVSVLVAYRNAALAGQQCVDDGLSSLAKHFSQAM